MDSSKPWKTHPGDACTLAVDVSAKLARCTLQHIARLKGLELTTTNPSTRIRLVAQIKARTQDGRITLVQADGPIIWRNHSRKYFGVLIQDTCDLADKMQTPSIVSDNYLVSIRLPGQIITTATIAPTNLICVQIDAQKAPSLPTKARLSVTNSHYIVELTKRYLAHMRFTADFASTQCMADQYIESIAAALTDEHPDYPFPALNALDKRLARAIAYLEDPSLQDYDVQATANAALTSERNLHYLMKRQLGITPYQFFLRSRLIEVRKELITCQCDKPKISWHAMNLGFTHLGRFSAQYQKLFGELPSTTLEWHQKKRELCG